MTREQKLALIVGFALVLFVGVLVSDHLSKANRPLASGDQAETLTRSLTPERSVAFGQPFDLGAVAGRTEPAGPGATPTRTPAETRIAATPEPAPPVAGRDTFRDRFQSVADAIADGAEEATSLLRDAQDNPVAARTGPISMMEMGRAPERPSEPDVEDDAATRSATTPERMWRTHRVAEGESLWGIADEYYGDGALYTELAESNGGRVGEDGRVRVGASILIPPRDELGSPAGAGTRVADGSSSREPEPGAEPDRRYTIRKGDTLGEISQRLLGTSKRWREIMELNEDVIDDEDVVPVGVTIKIPSR